MSLDTYGFLWCLEMLAFIGACLALHWILAAWHRWRDRRDRFIADAEANAHRVTVDIRGAKRWPA